MDAVVLAGGPLDDVARRQAGAPNKAFVEIAGVPMVERVLRALRAAACVDRIVVVAPPQTHASQALAAADERRSDGARISDSLRSGLQGLPSGQLVMIVTSDLPVLTPVSVDDFATRARALDADAIYGCLDRRLHLARFPKVPHTWAR
ncbi:MAG TPA: nucleotidyltransferase family protein, partial [Verrucomicrobiae bacterium]|nr:nucleotidyltransferase family protein [Verrucomicrobiae bacterium]